MVKILVYDTAKREKRDFIPLKENEVSIYCCGPTVYHDVHIGNMRTFVFSDFLRRMFTYFDFKVNFVMNITDVGHLTSDADEGEDKMLKGAKREHKTVWDIAEQYTNQFKADMKALNFLPVDDAHLPRATDHIKQMISFIQVLQEKGFTYIANGNVYFNTGKFAEYAAFANLNLDAKKQSRVGVDDAKKNPSDFVLWFTQSKFDDQAMKWESPWGVGYPGWHIECSAMSKELLGDSFDIHCGGHDLIHVHHTNEIAQSKCAGLDFAHYWMHGEFVIDNSGKISKSKGDFLTVSELVKRGYDPLAYRYLLCQSMYRKQLQFSFAALKAAQAGLLRLRARFQLLKNITATTENKGDEYVQEFENAISDDLNIPKALATMHKMLFDMDMDPQSQREMALQFDTVLGIGIDLGPGDVAISPDVQELLDRRQKARDKKDFETSDILRDELKGKGFIVKDSKEGQVLLKS